MDRAGVVRGRIAGRGGCSRITIRPPDWRNIPAHDRIARVHPCAMDRGAESRPVAGLRGDYSVSGFARSLLLSRDPTAQECPSANGELSGIGEPERRSGLPMNASNGQPGHNLIGETGDRGANVLRRNGSIRRSANSDANHRRRHHFRVSRKRESGRSTQSSKRNLPESIDSGKVGRSASPASESPQPFLHPPARGF